MGIQQKLISPTSSWRNPLRPKRIVGSIRRERLDRVIVLAERQLGRILKSYLLYYHSARPPSFPRLNSRMRNSFSENRLSPSHLAVRVSYLCSHVQFAACEFIAGIQCLIVLQNCTSLTYELGTVQLRVSPRKRPAEITGAVAEADSDCQMIGFVGFDYNASARVKVAAVQRLQHCRN